MQSAWTGHTGETVGNWLSSIRTCLLAENTLVCSWEAVQIETGGQMALKQVLIPVHAKAWPVQPTRLHTEKIQRQ